jgi:rhodanese-related sulfurtransferase
MLILYNMLGAIKKMFGLGKPAVNFSQLLKNGAVIIDVRSKGEFSSGAIKGAKNIPLDTLLNSIGKIDKSTTIITCCASGMRSGVARQQLISKGFTSVYNGGGWRSLQNKL